MKTTNNPDVTEQTQERPAASPAAIGSARWFETTPYYTMTMEEKRAAHDYWMTRAFQAESAVNNLKSRVDELLSERKPNAADQPQPPIEKGKL